ncbi:MAG: T9SS type B sorting domain-containing protein, partial [Roseivirga sp.]|nr:T9SS type B sorting domain-containing protein [Roseivirga sp.]
VTFTIQDDADIEGDETAMLTISNPSAGVTLGTTTTQNVAITDNDFPSVELSVSANAGTEAAGTVITVTATASQAVDGDQTVDLGVSGIGIANTDYTLSNATITILDGATTGMVTFTVQDDADIEGTETATLTISNPSAGLTLGATTTQNVIITDNDFPTVDLSVSANVGTEAAGTVITITAIASQAVDGDQTIDLGVSGTGITNTDYTLSNATITILNGQTTGSVTFTVQDDADIEGTETATLTISNPSVGITLGTTTAQNITITDNDVAGFSIVESDGTSVVSESGTTDDFTVVLNAQPASDVVINLSSADVGEVTVSPSTLTFTNANWNTPQTITLIGVDDNLSDGDQITLVTLTINDGSSDDSYDPLADQTVSVTTTDDDSAGFTIAESDGTSVVSESGTTDDFTVVLNAQPASDVVINLSSADVGEVNVSPSTLTFTNANWNTPQTITLTGVDDNLSDGDQATLITLAINDVSSDDAYDPLADQTVSVTTTDDDSAGFTIVESDGTSVVSESGTTDDFTVVLNAEPATDVMIDLSSADLGEVTVSPSTLTFTNANWNTPQTITLIGVDDNLSDGDQITLVTLTINDGSSDDSYDPLADQTVSVTTTDDDSAGFTIVESDGTSVVSESATTDGFTVVLNAQPASDVVIDLSSADVSEVNVSPSTLTFTNANWNTPQTITVTGVDDNLSDGDQTTLITLTINDGSSDDTYDPLADQTVSVTTTDDDIVSPSVELSVSTNIGSEASGTVVTVTATTSQAVSGDQTVDLGVGGTGITVMDYTLSNATITILNGQTTGTITFTIQDDADIEGTETATLTISNPSAGVILGTTTTQNVVITDNDFPTINLSVSTNAGTETAGTVITVTATASQAVDGDQTVDLGVSGTGIANTDYTLSNAAITILNGQTTGTVTFTVQDDTDIEGDETAILTISNPSAGLTLGATITQNITITDDDFAANPTVDLSVSANAGTETAQTVVTVTATASQAVDGDQTIDLGVSGTGITNTDYILSNATITILNGQTTGSITFTIQDDADIEGDETTTLTLSNPSAGVTLGTTTTQNVAITDNDFPSVELSVSANAGTEAAGTVVTVTATASQAVDGDQTVDLGVTGTGIANTDYTLSNATITILDGATTGMITFTIQDDADIEGDETATLAISNPSAGVTLGTTTTQNVIITDNDFPTVDLSVSANAGTEADGTVITITAIASKAVDGDQTVDLGVSGTGITNTDYTLNNATITILNGQTTGTITFTIQDDADIEGTETATLTISNPSAGVILGTTTTQNVVITDNDFPTINLSVSTNAGTETAGTVITVTATASQAVDGDQTVDLGVSGTGIANTDYTLSNAAITILNGQTTGTVTFTIQDDADIEGDETAILTISNPSAGLTLGTTTTQNVAITDNDFPTVDLSVSANTGTEAAGTVITVTATASQAVDGDQTVGLGVSGTGIANTDYTLSNATITILNGQTTGTVTFTVQDDTDIEGDETATLTINNPSAGVTLGTTTTQNVIITDNDFPTVDLSVSANAGTEADGTVITITAIASKAVDGDQTVDLGVSGTGITNTDYTLNNATITILDGATTGTVTFTIQDDADIEGDETATLAISNPSAGVTLGTTTTQNVIITDNDFPTVDLSVSANTGTETAGTAITVTATASQVVSGDQTVDLGVSGTGITNTDYTLSNTTVTILNGQAIGTVTFTVQDDTDIEGDETANLTISNPSAGVILGTVTTENIIITDNDEVEPDLINTTITVSPTSLVADGVTSSLITVQLVDSDGNPLSTSRGIVTLNVTGSALLTAVSDNGDGTYTAMLTNTFVEVVTVTGQWDGLNLSAEVEVTFTPDNTDTDGDGVFDRLEDLNMNGDLEDDDTDRDGTPNYLDTDDDGDSVPTRQEDPDGDGDPQNDDTDSDQIPNYLDSDDDGDGIFTIDEDANNNGDLFDDDTDGDGLINFLDPVENMVVDKLFSPNGDGINDVLQIRDAEKFPNNKVSIFNRQGNLIFELESYDNRGRGWNGIPNRGLLTSGDKIVPNGTYFYVIEPNDGSETLTGFFVLKR